MSHDVSPGGLLLDRYAIDRELGRGGMATVYLAHDRKHERRVAIKVLHADLAAALGPERFLQEIRVTANLQHPHILGLIDSGLFGADAGELEGRPYYVMPYVDGESLRQRLDRERQLPVAEAVRLATEVAGALDYAHRHGVIHRDIKPENILLHDGQALVADFGIALAVQQAGTNRMTQTGLSLGTPQYMSPEQAMGEKTITARSDLYALGAVTYEMLAGEPPFTGPTVQAIVARLMSEPPRPLGAQRRSIPAHVDDAVMQALEKVPADRFATAAEFAAALAAPGATTSVRPTRGEPARRPRALLTAGLPWLLAAGASGVAGWSFRRAPDTDAAPAIRAVLPLGDSADVGAVRVLPGDSLLVATGRGGLSLVRLATGEPTPLRGTEGASHASASPDGRALAFVARGQLWRMELPDGAPAPLAPVKNAECTAWRDDDRIAVCEDGGVNMTVVPADGGVKDTLRSVLGTRGSAGVSSYAGGGLIIPNDTGHRVLVAGRARFFSRRGFIDTLPGDGAESVPSGSWAQLLASGHLAWITRDRRLVVAPLDVRAGRITGPAVSLADSVVAAHFGTRGLLTLIRGVTGRDVFLVLASRGGRRDTLPYPLAEYQSFDVSPDGRRVAVVVAVNGVRELRILDVDHPATRVLPVRRPHEPRWSHDGRRIAVSQGGGAVLLDPDDPARIDTLVRTIFFPHAWTPDDREIAGSAILDGAYGALTRVRPGVDTAPRRAARVNGNDFHQTFSPDGRWYAFRSTGYDDERSGIYVAENREGAVPVQITDGRYDDPSWSADGRELVVLDHPAKTFASIPVTPGAPPQFGKPVPLFAADRLFFIGGKDLVLLRDGRILFREGMPRTPVRAVTLVTSWRAEYERRSRGAAAR